jgi:hypothetical protein
VALAVLVTPSTLKRSKITKINIVKSVKIRARHVLASTADFYANKVFAKLRGSGFFSGNVLHQRRGKPPDPAVCDWLFCGANLTAPGYDHWYRFNRGKQDVGRAGSHANRNT